MSQVLNENLGRPRGPRDVSSKSRMPIDDGIKNLIVEGKHAPEIKREAVKNDMRTLLHSALRKLAEGITTFEEEDRDAAVYKPMRAQALRAPAPGAPWSVP